jgi:hypothetical protein
MCALRSREDRRRFCGVWCWCGTTCQPHRFAADDLEPCASDATARPVFPHQRSKRKCLRGGVDRRRSIREDGFEWPEHGAHPPRLDALPAHLTLSSQGTGATMADASSIQDPKGAIALGSALLWIEGTISGATQGPIGLQGKSGTGKASGKRRTGPLGRTILHLRRGFLSRYKLDGRGWLAGKWRLDSHGFGKFRRAQL